MPSLRSRILVALSLIVVAACNSTRIIEGPSGRVAALVVSPSPLNVISGHSVQLSVVALDDQQRLLTGIPVAFQSGDTTVATVSSDGMVRARAAAGHTSITAAAGGVQTTVSL